jgi:hypothetical protein
MQPFVAPATKGCMPFGVHPAQKVRPHSVSRGVIAGHGNVIESEAKQAMAEAFQAAGL